MYTLTKVPLLSMTLGQLHGKLLFPYSGDLTSYAHGLSIECFFVHTTIRQYGIYSAAALRQGNDDEENVSPSHGRYPAASYLAGSTMGRAAGGKSPDVRPCVGTQRRCAHGEPPTYGGHSRQLGCYPTLANPYRENRC